VKPKSEELLNMLLFTADMMLQPTFRNLNQSYEGWLYREGLMRRVKRLEKAELIERDSLSEDDRIFRLTAAGRIRVLGGRDPEERWNRKWDGSWRMILFDIPNTQNSERVKLWRYLRNHHFGCLQNSVWTTPDPLQQEEEILADGKVNAGSLLLLDARPCAGESDGEIVDTAWDFDRINERYRKLESILKQRPKGGITSEASSDQMREWARDEHHAWLDAVQGDPLLPKTLHPKGYLGPKTWQKRKTEFAAAGSQIQKFTIE